ncbi:GNAT family N-acetyltransferase [uncultured Mucilaginibacter sp.]|uniref:GNAT family N-acetyltransferase n=1 Tax=uncultured Mucilaginibacter sp. TaxID=797541 RepID=UPI002602725D|nr:GNAT family N-acetyltransferase [uncultured Mucilaginibacter sp.]
MSYPIEPLRSDLNKKDFSCGKQLLDNYLQKQAGQDVKRKLCAVFAMTEGTTIIGYYTLSNAGINREMIPEDLRKKMPASYTDLPATSLLGRLAINEKYRGKGLGELLLLDALKRNNQVSQAQIGSMAIIVDPLDENAEAFYKKYDFISLPDSKKMFLPMQSISSLFKP